MRLLSILAAFALAQQTLATNSTSSTSPEQLFLEFSIHDVYDNTTGADFVEPWASAYVKSIQEKRYGDAIWARYHMYGDVENGIVEGSDNMTVLEVIEEDARDYRVDHSGLYTEALSFYAKTSSQDADTANVLDVLRRVGEEDITELEKRKTYGISCSTNWLAYYTSCETLIMNMQDTQTLVGNRRAVTSYGNCHLRMGPYKGSSTDSTFWTDHAVSKLIIQECTYVPSCCSYKTVSGYSPKNSGHRKICLSRKNSGCS